MNKKNKYRLFGIISPVDVIIVAGAAAFVLWAMLIFSAPTSASTRESDVKITYTIELSKREAGFHSRVRTGTIVYDTLRGYAIGTVVDVYALPFREDAPDEENNIFRRTPVGGYEFTYVVVEAHAQVSDQATAVGQYEILVNKEVFVTSKTFAGQGYITSLERAD